MANNRNNVNELYVPKAPKMAVLGNLLRRSFHPLRLLRRFNPNAAREGEVNSCGNAGALAREGNLMRVGLAAL
jgi:hypothetical protein